MILLSLSPGTLSYLSVSLSWYPELFGCLFLLVPWVIWLSLSPGTMGYLTVSSSWYHGLFGCLFPLIPLVILLSLSLGILESWVLTPLSTILSLMKYTCGDRLSCTVYVTNEHLVRQLMLLIFFCIDHTPENFKRKQTPAVHTIFLRVI